jgi:hypothetical protein
VHQQGTLSDGEFTTAKAKLLGISLNSQERNRVISVDNDTQTSPRSAPTLILGIVGVLSGGSLNMVTVLLGLWFVMDIFLDHRSAHALSHEGVTHLTIRGG